MLVNDAQCDLNAVNRNGQSVLHVLVESGNDDAALWMVRRGASLGIRDNRGRTATDLSGSFAAALASSPRMLSDSSGSVDQLSGSGALRAGALKNPRATSAKESKTALAPLSSSFK